ncbi:glycosyltransferase [Microbacterium laevaniformans]|jgi:dolichol-phosphate mannosyltransferase|uniref:glycosyltransferase n=1 Tax=Microbacterium TaxID=33882 RepID=UPI0002588BEF|nr:MULTISPECIES: glycosyltransferase family 2 protein [Microbacterium]EIC06653.1 glycosyl transferase family 2 [Microbacterium laevaniformans OR221]EPD85697.1 dolichol-phosphate mannosyltransferase [Microbacterium sp. oral taxon 186 str. F0373]MBM7751378.1 dolichol-phosphate mannosyltransferase [Microbacterium laevaniformans]RKS90050.1 dolichol-phosphate mannosyltransferase [Microbacterium sp. AG790]GLJ63537.1 dolichol monophosphate mannose synthase [Microbacterium laevaniformans]
MDLSVIVPTFNEGGNVAELVRRIGAALDDVDFEVVFVDDSTDDTPATIQAVAASTDFPVRLIHRDEPEGGLSGAVLEGFRNAQARWCLVMDGDLQHPPEDIPRMLDRAALGDVDIVVASRYVAGGTAGGLAGATRTAVSRTSTLLTKAMFPRKLHGCTDPMTGFFLVDRDTVDLDDLRPRGFKILLEILARRQMRIGEIPFAFATRFAGESKATFSQGMRFLTQLAMLRFGRMSAFALVGGVGAIANLVIMWGLIHLGMNYLTAAIIASEVTIIGNFLLLEYLVFADMRSESGQMWVRFLKSFAFNNVEAVVRIPIIPLLVQGAHIPSVLAAAITLAAAFVVRFVYHALWVYAPKNKSTSRVATRGVTRAAERTLES